MKGTRERRSSYSKELQNVSIVRNKGEQVQLEKKRRFLEAMEKESLGLMNKKRELIDLKKLSFQPSSLSDTRPQEVSHWRIVSKLNTKESLNEDAPRRDRFAISRSKSLSGLSRIPPITQNTGASCRPRLCPHMSLSRSLGRGEICPICRRFPAAQDRVARTDLKSDSETKNGANEERDIQNKDNISKLLPPACLLPLYKQNSKSLKEMAKALQKERKSPGTRKACSWHDLSNCRYLRTWTNNLPCHERLNSD